MKNSIPVDLIIEIVLRLPAKSVARCRCVSKLWRSILCRQDFTELFLTKSKARPRLLIGVEKDGEWSFYSTPQPQNPYQKSSLADFHKKFSKGISGYDCSYTSGLIYFHDMPIPRVDEVEKRVIYNPLTGRYVILPQLRGYSYSYLGFDPIDKEFKVLTLLMNTSDNIANSDTDHYILTLGTGELLWRKIQCSFNHVPFGARSGRICINGVLYYSAHHSHGTRSYMIVCFDVRSEKFKFIRAERCFYHLINYKGSLCGINFEYEFSGGGFPLKLSMCVMEDVEKQEWSNYVYSLWDESEVVICRRNLSIYGVTATGDIVFSDKYPYNPFYVFYFNPERNTLQIVEMQGVRVNDHCRVFAFVDYVEDLSVNDALQLKSSPLKQGQNIISKRPKPQQRRRTSRDLSKSSHSVKNKQQNKYGLLTNLFCHSVALAILFFVSFCLFFVFFLALA